MSGHRITADLQKADTVLLDPGNTGTIRSEGWINVVELVTGGSGETRTLADPDKSGQLLILTLKTDGGGDCEVSNAKYLTSGNHTKVTLGDATDTVLLTSIPNGTSGYRWIIVGNESASTGT